MIYLALFTLKKEATNFYCNFKWFWKAEFARSVLAPGRHQLNIEGRGGYLVMLQLTGILEYLCTELLWRKLMLHSSGA